MCHRVLWTLARTARPACGAFCQAQNKKFWSFKHKRLPISCNRLTINTPFHSRRREHALPHFVWSGRGRNTGSQSRGGPAGLVSEPVSTKRTHFSFTCASIFGQRITWQRQGLSQSTVELNRRGTMSALAVYPLLLILIQQLSSTASTRPTSGHAQQMFTLHRLCHGVAKRANTCSASSKTPRWLNGVSGGERWTFFSFFFILFFWLHSWAKLATKFGSGRGILFQHVTNPDTQPGTGRKRHNTVITQAHVWGAHSSLENRNVLSASLSQVDQRRRISASAGPLK